MSEPVSGIPEHVKSTNPTFDPKLMVFPWDQHDVRDLYRESWNIDPRLGQHKPCINIGYIGNSGEDSDGHVSFSTAPSKLFVRGLLSSTHLVKLFDSTNHTFLIQAS
jgi:hypothetical protein